MTEQQRYRPGVFFIVPLLMMILALSIGGVAFAPVTTGQELAFTADPRRLIVLGLAYAIALVAVLRVPGSSLGLVRNRLLYVGFLLFVLVSMLWSAYPVKVVINFGHYAGLMLVAMAAAQYLRTRGELIFRLLAVVLGVSILASILVSLMLPAVGIDAYTGRWQGVAGNPNTLGLICATSIWANLTDLLGRRQGRRLWINLPLLGLSAAALFGSMSMTSIVVTALIACSLPLLFSMEHDTLDRRVIKYLVLIWIGLVLVLAIWIGKPELLTLEGALQAMGKDTSLTGRLTIWELAIQAIEARPYLGWSFDSRLTVLHEFGFGKGQFHNGYLDILVRGGVLGLSLFVLMAAQILVSIRRAARHEFRQAMAWLVLLVVILVHNLTEASIMRETHLFWILFVFMYFFLADMHSQRSIAGDPRAGQGGPEQRVR